MTGHSVAKEPGCERLHFRFSFFLLILVRKLNVWVWATAKGTVAESKLREIRSTVFVCPALWRGVILDGQISFLIAFNTHISSWWSRRPRRSL